MSTWVQLKTLIIFTCAPSMFLQISNRLVALRNTRFRDYFLNGLNWSISRYTTYTCNCHLHKKNVHVTAYRLKKIRVFYDIKGIKKREKQEKKVEPFKAGESNGITGKKCVSVWHDRFFRIIIVILWPAREEEEKEAREKEILLDQRNKSPYLTRNGTLWHFSMKSHGWILSGGRRSKRDRESGMKYRKRNPMISLLP